MSERWYQSVSATERITQGDLISECPLVGWQSERLQLEGVPGDEILRGATVAVRADVVVMTQACDLEHEKVDNVILCPHTSLAQSRLAWEEQMAAMREKITEKRWQRWCDDVRQGFVWNLSMLNAGAADGLAIEHRIVDFHAVYAVPRLFLESVLIQRAVPRLRLLPPYREHLSQAFARFFMRVGLPTPIERAW